MDIFVVAKAGPLLFFIRIIMGIVMLYYGTPKIKSPKKNIEDFVGMGWRPAWFWATINTFLEFFGGIAMVLGFYAEVVAALFGIQMILGTFWKMKVRRPFTDYSYDVLLLAIAAVILTFGSGAYAIR